MKNSSKTPDLKLEDISHRLDDTLIEFIIIFNKKIIYKVIK